MTDEKRAVIRRAADQNRAALDRLTEADGPVLCHNYLSTACGHGECGSCRNTCKFCGSACVHGCHPHNPTAPTPASPVDQARDLAIQLLDQLQRVEPGQPSNPELAERIRTDPALFWLRGEVQPAGEWHP